MAKSDHENVLVVTDPTTSEVGRALYEAASEVTDRILMMMMPRSHMQGNEPPASVGYLMRRQNVVLLATKNSLTHTRARLTSSREGARIASMPGITEAMMASGGMTADYNALQKEISGLNPLPAGGAMSELLPRLELISDSEPVLDGFWKTTAFAIVRAKSPIYQPARYSYCLRNNR